MREAVTLRPRKDLVKENSASWLFATDYINSLMVATARLSWNYWAASLSKVAVAVLGLSIGRFNIIMFATLIFFPAGGVRACLAT